MIKVRFTALSLLLCLLLSLMAITGCAGGRDSQSNIPDVPLDDILDQIRDAYGDDFLPVMDIPQDLLELQYGLTDGLYEQAKGLEPMIGAHPDVVLVAKAAPGRADDVQKAFEQARDRKINDELQYPMNLAKVNAAKVVRKGDYVAFLLVGALYEGEGSEQEQKEFAENEVQKAVDVFEASFR